MGRISIPQLLAVLVAGVLVFVSSGAIADELPPTVGGVQSGANSAGEMVHGWLLTPDHGATARISTERHGCADCVWSVSAFCLLDTGTSGPDGQHCSGQLVSCPQGEQRYRVFLATPTTPSTLVAQYCRADTSGVISEATILPDVHRYLDQMAVAKPSISSWPAASSLVNLPTFFAATPAAPGDRTFGGNGFTMTLRVVPASYDWEFGDGSTLVTTEPGAGPPTGTIRHTYAAAGNPIAALSVAYAATYSLTTPVGGIGPFAVPGLPVRSAPAQFSLRVDEAIATLIR
jgi:hypothetical protein